ncbi:MAG TPA: efflux RND transporter periplasmic adaptor subunit [Vicinamibacterales bacterium]|nr:efflux RND transporter periplasmic adaptor subunit [Vicinamibacterales bacterium]
MVKNPSTNRFFQLREAEHFITRQLDGATALEVVRQRTEERFGVSIKQPQIDAFVEQLRRQGLLDSGAAVDRPRQKWMQGSSLYIRFRAFDPDRLLDWLHPRVSFFFTRTFLIVSAVIICWAIGVAVLERDAILREVRGLWRFDAFLLAWVAILAVTTCHEFAHGLTCKHFGGEVHEMGFLLIYFQPAFYCNISDAWLFPERAKRLWVTFAGAYFEMFLWGLATLVWRVADTNTWVSFIALIVMVTSAFKWFFNFNPLIKLDGYYLLSDYLGIPNLRQRAIDYFWSRVKGLWTRTVPAVAVSPRERRIFLLYGSLAGIYSYWLIGTIALAFGSYLIEQYRGTGAAVFAAVAGSPFYGRIRRLGGRMASGVQAATPLSWRPSRRTAVALAALALFVSWWIPMEVTVSGDFKVLPLHNADVRAQVDGLIERVFVDEGTRVRAGDVIATLADRDLRAELAKTEAERLEHQAELNRLQAGPRAEEVVLAKSEMQTAVTAIDQLRARAESAREVRGATLARAASAVEKAAAQLEFARTTLNRFDQLLREGLISKQVWEQARVDVEIRQRELSEAEAEARAIRADDSADLRVELSVAERRAVEARAKLDLLLAGSRAEQIDLAQATVAGLDAQTRHLETALGFTRVVSPTDGIVTTPSRELAERVGQFVKRGDLVLEVHELRSVVAEIAVAEWEAGDVEPGQPVRVRTRAYPGHEFTGRVTAVATTLTARDPSATDTASNRDRVLLVTTTLDNAAQQLKPGMYGYARISCGRRGMFGVLTRRLSSFVRTEFWF